MSFVQFKEKLLCARFAFSWRRPLEICQRKAAIVRQEFLAVPWIGTPAFSNFTLRTRRRSVGRNVILEKTAEHFAAVRWARGGARLVRRFQWINQLPLSVNKACTRQDLGEKSSSPAVSKSFYRRQKIFYSNVRSNKRVSIHQNHSS